MIRIFAGVAILATVLLGCSGSAVAPDEAASSFRDCGVCPEMVALPTGTFLMGTAEADRLIDPRTGNEFDVV